MKMLALGVGVIAGMAIATATINAMYPDVSRRMARDGKNMIRCTKRHLRKLV